MDRRECYWLYVVTQCTRPNGARVTLIGDPARLPWHEPRKAEQRDLSARALTPASSVGAHG